MSVVDLTFNCQRPDEHADGKPRTWQAQGQERIMDPLSQEFSPVVIAADGACPECHNIGAADYPGTVYVIPDDDSNREVVAQIRAEIAAA